MSNPRHLTSIVLPRSLIYLSFLLGGLTAHVEAQQPKPLPGTPRAIQLDQELDGVQLDQQADSAEAMKALEERARKHPDDADAWYSLGLALNSKGRIGEARPRFERLIQLRPYSADAHAKLAYALILANEPEKAIIMARRAIELGDVSLEAHYAIAEASLRLNVDPLRTGPLATAVEEAENTLRLDPNFALALITKSFAQFRLNQYHEAATSLQGFLGISPDDVDAGTWREQVERLLKRAASPPTTPAPSDTTVLTGKMVTQKARILSKPEPQYTEAARKAGVQGTVVLKAVFASDGEVKNLLVVQALGYGITTKAMQAARRIKFEPATKDGRPVSMWFQLEYNFNLY